MFDYPLGLVWGIEASAGDSRFGHSFVGDAGR
jgi:hypothetical protein